MKYCKKLQNYRTDMWKCRTQNRWQGEESGMSGVKASIERTKMKRVLSAYPIIWLSPILTTWSSTSVLSESSSPQSDPKSSSSSSQ